MRTATIVAAALAATAGLAHAQEFPVQGDVVVGLSNTNVVQTVRLYSPAGVQKADLWEAFSFAQSVEWDNSGGILHNPNGRLIGGNFGTVPLGGSIYVYQSGAANGWSGVLAFGCSAAATCAPVTFNTPPLNGVPARLGGVSVSPDNAQIAFTSSDTGQIYVLQYDAATSSVTSADQTQDLPTPLGGGTCGSTWLDDTTVIAVSPLGNVVTVDTAVTPLTAVSRLSLPGAPTTGSTFASITYTPEIADFVYISISDFVTATGTTTNRLYAVNPTTWQVAAQIDLSTSNPTSREIALASNGDLFLSTFSGSTPPANPPGGIFRIPDVRNSATMTNNSSVLVTLFNFNSSFNGMDVACAVPVGGAPCYPDCTGEGTLTVADFGCFQGKYVLGDLYADCNTSGNLTVADFGCFQGKYVLGCP